jgi:hypothetical protein
MSSSPPQHKSASPDLLLQTLACSPHMFPRRVVGSTGEHRTRHGWAFGGWKSLWPLWEAVSRDWLQETNFRSPIGTIRGESQERRKKPCGAMDYVRVHIFKHAISCWIRTTPHHATLVRVAAVVPRGWDDEAGEYLRRVPGGWDARHLLKLPANPREPCDKSEVHVGSKYPPRGRGKSLSATSCARSARGRQTRVLPSSSPQLLLHPPISQGTQWARSGSRTDEAGWVRFGQPTQLSKIEFLRDLLANQSGRVGGAFSSTYPTISPFAVPCCAARKLAYLYMKPASHHLGVFRSPVSPDGDPIRGFLS